MPTIYDNFKRSDVKNNDGYYYPDVLTNDWNKFEFTSLPEEVFLNEIQANRLDILLTEKGINNKYWDLILVINNVKYANDLNSGDTLYLPTSEDLENFYLNYIKENED